MFKTVHEMVVIFYSIKSKISHAVLRCCCNNVTLVVSSEFHLKPVGMRYNNTYDNIMCFVVSCYTPFTWLNSYIKISNLFNLEWILCTQCI